MLIYFDSKDLINMLQRGTPISVKQLENFLKSNNQKVVLSFLTIMEIAAPLLHKKATTNVMVLLNHLEELPHTFIHSDISRLELQEALRAYSAGDSYKGISPFVNRFDETCDLNASPATKNYINYYLSEIVWDLYHGGALGGLDNYATTYLRQTFAADRALAPKLSLKTHFATEIRRELRLHHMTIPHERISSFAEWIYSDVSRCPSKRLIYEIWHKMLRNITDVPHDSDLEDFQHIACLPYVDLMTLDRRMHEYVCQVSKSNSVANGKKIF